MDRYSQITKSRTKTDWIRSKGIEYYTTNQYPEVKKLPSDIYVLTEWGDRLDLLANQFYGNTTLWWVIAVSNPNKIKMGTLLPDPGLQLRIPADPNRVINEYNAMNYNSSFTVDSGTSGTTSGTNNGSVGGSGGGSSGGGGY